MTRLREIHDVQCLRLTVVALVWFLSFDAIALPAPQWTRIVADNSFLNIPGIPFALSVIESNHYVISAGFWYRYTVGTDPVTLHGRKTADGRFWPNIQYERAIVGQREWQGIPCDEQKGSDTLSISPSNPIAMVWVDMEPLRKLIGIARYARINLETGERATIAVEDLLPTADAKGDSSDFKDIMYEPDDAKLQDGFSQDWLATPVDLLSVVSFGNRLVGEFVFDARSKDIIVEGTRTLDGDFWAKSTLRSAASNKVWKTIGQPRHAGEPEKLTIRKGTSEKVRVLLSDYKSMPSQTTFGRVVFSNGDAATFSIDALHLR